jgi:multiple sugar transport system substrate-binding protein
MIKEQLMRRSIFIILLFSLLLFACRSQDNGPAVSDVETTITLAAPTGFQTAYEQLIHQFQEDYPRIHVQFMPLSGQQANLSLRQQATLADVVLLEGQPPTTDAAAAFLNLAPLMAADPTFDAADFWPGIMDACRAAGVQIGLPFRANASLIFFDKAAFDAAGLPHPEPGWTWEDFRQAAQALALSDGEQTTRYGFVDSGNPMGLLAPLVDNIIRQSGDTLDGRRIAAELAWYVTLANDNVILSESGSLPHERQAAMWVSSQFGLTAARAVLGDDLGVAAFPATGVSQSNPVTAGCALISAGTSHSQAAWTFVHYLSQQALFATGVYPATPARPSVAQSSQYWERMEEEAGTATRAALEQGWYRRADMPELANVGNALTQALSGETSLAESLPETVAIQPTAPPPTPDGDPVVVATPRATPTHAPDRDVLIVEHYSSGAHTQEAAIALARAFNEMQDNFEVRVTTNFPSSGSSFLENLANAADCISYGGTAGGASSLWDDFQDYFYSLQPLLDNEPASFQEDFDPDLWEWNQIDGELYGLPGPIQPYMVYYNASLLADLGLDPPSPDWTVEDFWELAEAATRAGGDRSIYGFVPYELWPSTLVRFVPQAEYFFDASVQPPAPAFDDPAVIQTLSWLNAMVETGVMFPNDQFGARTSWDYDNTLRIEQGLVISRDRRAAMWVDVARAYRPNWSIQMGVAPFPQTDLVNLYQSQQGFTFLISKRTAVPTGCWEWLKFLSTQPDAFAGIPPRLSVRTSSEWVDVVGAEAAAAYEVALSRRQTLPPELLVWPYSTWGWQYGSWWADALQDVFASGDPATVLRDTQLQAELFHRCVSAFEDPANATGRACAEEADPNFWQGRSPPTP